MSSNPKTGDDQEVTTSHEVSKETDSDGELKIKHDEKSSEKSSHEKATSPLSKTATETESRRSSDPLQSTAQTSESGRKSPGSECSGRPKSSTSDVIYDSKKKKKKQVLPPDAHPVTFTITLAMAIPTNTKNIDSETYERMYGQTVHDEFQPNMQEMLKKRKRVFDAPRAQNYFHCEYNLIPEDDELVRSDVVTYGVAGKLFLERHEPKVIKTWQDGDITWIAWSQSHTINVTKDLLLKMYKHTLELRVWDTKDKVSARARFDRPKFFKIPQGKPGEGFDDIGGVKAMVTKQIKGFSKMQPKKGCAVRPLPSTVSIKSESSTKVKPPKTDSKENTTEPTDLTDTKDGHQSPDKDKTGSSFPSPSPDALVALPNMDLDNPDSRNKGSPGRHKERTGRESKQSGHQSPAKSIKSTGSKERTSLTARSTKSPGKSPPSAVGAISVSSSQQPIRESPARTRRNKKAEAAAQAAAELIKKFGKIKIPVRMAVLFSGIQEVTNRLESPVQGIEDVFITLSLDSPLMSEEQKLDLNPMIIKVNSATHMPDSPLTHGQLNDRCRQVYCRYQFFRQPVYETTGKKHEKNIYWDDTNVVLAGTLEPSELRQYLNGLPFEIEVHDRDRKTEDTRLKPTLFGDDLEDEKINNVGAVTSKRTIHNPFQSRDTPWDPYGIAKVNLSELLLGQKYLYMKIPIQNCIIPDVLSIHGKLDSKLIGIGGAVDGPVDRPLSAGHYVNSNATLKVTVELAHPLVTHKQVLAKEDIKTTFECPFNRIIFMFDYNNVDILNQIQSLVSKINALALELDDMPQHVIDAALSTYKLSLEQQSSRELDIVTGFQLLDGNIHIFVLEGLREHAIKQLWETVACPETSDVRVYYNSDMSFSERLYGPLDVDLCRVKLHEPLPIIIQQPLLYVRDMVPKPCFEALVKIDELTKMDKMRDIVRNALFPTSEMIVSMSKEFGVPLTMEDLEELQPKIEEPPPTKKVEIVELSGPQTSRIWTPIAIYNPNYMNKILDREKKGSNHNFLEENLELVKHQSEINKLQRQKTMPARIAADVEVAHNYSTQSLNSTELAKEKLRQLLAKNPDTRYTYCQDYHHSMTVVPVNVDALKKQEQEEDRALWRTNKGFIYPGMKTMQESNINPRKPDEARIDELKEEWRENILHANILQPTLNRSTLPWKHRKFDMELYKKPPFNFGHTDPITIHEAGEKQKHERLSACVKDYENWKSKIVVADTKQYFKRCLPATETTIQGQDAACQIDKLKGILKDKAEKYSLKTPGFYLKDIPSLNVVLNPSVDTSSRAEGHSVNPAVEGEMIEKTKGFQPGPYTENSWCLEKNVVPAYNYEHRKYIESRGQDFNVYHTDRNALWKRTIHPLNSKERDNHLFRLPDYSTNYDILPEINRTQTSLIENVVRTDTLLDDTSLIKTVEAPKVVETVVN